jgi:transcriptional regulator with XRE-family HTH domain
MSIAVELGKKLKMIRIAAGIEQKNLSEKLNVTVPLLSMYEKGTIKPSLNFYKTFAQNFNLPLSRIFAVIEENFHNEQ